MKVYSINVFIFLPFLFILDGEKWSFAALDCKLWLKSLNKFFKLEVLVLSAGERRVSRFLLDQFYQVREVSVKSYHISLSCHDVKLSRLEPTDH